MLLGWLFSHVVIFGTVALRLKILSALFVAGSALLVRRLAISFGATEFPAFLVALVFAFTSVAWSKALHTDVHAMALFLSLAVFVSAMTYARSQDVRFLFFAAFAYGAGLATHPNVLWSGLSLLPGFSAIARRDVRLTALLLVTAIVPLTCYAYLPIRSTVIEAARLDPAEAAPIFGVGDVAWDYNRPSSWPGFLKETAGTDSSNGAFRGFFAVSRYPEFGLDWATAAARELTPVTIVLAAAGLFSLVRAPRRVRIGAAFVVAGAFAALPFTFSFGAEADVTRYVFASLAVALALAACSPKILPRFAFAATAAVSFALVVVLAVTWTANAYQFGARNDREAQPIIDRAQRDIPDGAIVVSPWIELMPLTYAAYVDRSLGSRVPINWDHGDVQRYLAWSRTRSVYLVADFSNGEDVKSDIPARCRRLVVDYGGKNILYQIRAGGPGCNEP